MRISLVFLAAFLAGSPAFANGPLTPVLQREVCDFALNPAVAKKDRLEAVTQREGWIDINNDDVDEHVEINDGQTTYSSFDGEEMSPFLPDDAQAVAFDMAAKNGKWLHYRNHTFLLSVTNESLWYINADSRASKLCGVTPTKRVKTARPDRNFQTEFDVDQLCENVARHRDMDYIVPEEITPLDVDLNLSARAEVAVDIDHDGTEDPAYYVQYVQMAAEKSCSFQYFLLKGDVHAKGSEEAPLSPLGNQLYWAQHSRPDDTIGQAPTQPCEGLQDTRLFRFEGKIFLERGDLAKGAGNPDAFYHQVWYFKDGKRFNLCRFDLRQDRNYRLEPLPTAASSQMEYPEESQVD